MARQTRDQVNARRPPTAPLRWLVRCGSLGGCCTASSERTRPRPARTTPFELKKIKLAWPDLNYATAKGVLILLPSTPDITPVEQAQLTS